MTNVVNIADFFNSRPSKTTKTSGNKPEVVKRHIDTSLQQFLVPAFRDYLIANNYTPYITLVVPEDDKVRGNWFFPDSVSINSGYITLDVSNNAVESVTTDKFGVINVVAQFSGRTYTLIFCSTDIVQIYAKENPQTTVFTFARPRVKPSDGPNPDQAA